MRVLSETVRIVPQSVAVSGMTLVVVPARILATVTTAGSNASIRRVTIAWSAVTISQAIGIGSHGVVGHRGVAAPAPDGDLELVGRRHEGAGPRWRSSPSGIVGVWWMAKAIDTGSAPAAAVASRPSSSMYRAPWWPSSPGWNMKATRPARRPAAPASSLAAPASIATWVSWPQACMASSSRLANSSPVSSCIGRASMSPRSSTVGPGLVAVEHGDDATRSWCRW